MIGVSIIETIFFQIYMIINLNKFKRINVSVLLFPGFDIVAEVITSKRGYPRIFYNGHDYGFKTIRGEVTIWLCTASFNKRRCTGSVETKVINNTLMMKVKNRKHFCEAKNNRQRSKEYLSIGQIFREKEEIKTIYFLKCGIIQFKSPNLLNYFVNTWSYQKLFLIFS